VLACADALLVHLKDDPLFEITIPSKMQAYMAVGKPVLMAVRGDAASIIQESGGGLCCEPENPASLGAAIGQLLALSKPDLEAMGQRGQAYYMTNLATRVGVKRIEAVFERSRGSRAAYSFGKRAFDFLVALVALMLSSPVILVVAYLIRSRLGSPVLFSQDRPGLHGKVFCMFKFRTMSDARDAQGKLLSDTERLTAFGKWLRASSLDELPGLWNVLCGDMSLVGPRPLRVNYLGRYSPEQARRHQVRPGITGWAQVNGRNAISWTQKFNLDVWYVDHWSFLLDLRILWLTVFKVFARDGVNSSEEVPMPEFMGVPGE
jgi:lipopolysaccharide/colanic/teichoic acid biosynthesis glycosyltransferase